MSRIRTIKPEFWTSEQIMECSPLARLAFIGMWNFCDDNGVHPASCKTLKAEVFPGDDLTASNVQEVVNELLKQGLLAEFSDENRMWWFVTGWHHQLINRPSKSRYPLPPRHAPPTDSVSIHGTLTEDSVSIHGGLTEDSLQEGKGKEGKGREEEGRVSAPAPNAPTATALPSASEVEPEAAPEATAKQAPAKTKPKEHPSASSGQRAAAIRTSLPAGFTITPEIQAWADQHHYGDLPAHLDSFRDKAKAKGYQYSDWTAAFRNAVRDDWAKLRTFPDTARTRSRNASKTTAPQTAEAAEFESILQGLRTQNARPVIEGECYATH